MSHVSGVVLCTSICESPSDDDELGPAWLEVQAWLVERSFAPLALVDKHFSGSKAPQMLVGGGGFNYFPENDFVNFVLGRMWECPENVVLVIEPEEGHTRIFRVEREWVDQCATCGAAIDGFCERCNHG